MARVDDLLTEALKGLPSKPPQNASQSTKRKYSQDMSAVIARALAEELRQRGMDGCRPAPPGVGGRSGAERRLAGGIGAKKVDISWSTEEGGLILGGSVKTINFRDGTTKNFQKNLTNRRGDMLFEAVTLHRRFPYAVLIGFLFLDKDAKNDGTARRNSTFVNAFPRLRLFTGRQDPSGRDEQYERLLLFSVDANPAAPHYECYSVDDPAAPIDLDQALNDVVQLIAERNFDTYEAVAGALRRLRA